MGAEPTAKVTPGDGVGDLSFVESKRREKRDPQPCKNNGLCVTIS